MNRIESIFDGLRSSGRKALMPFVTAGYPSLSATKAILPALQAGGASICEVGMPFSDPIADGPVIQASMTHALAAGATSEAVFDAVASVRGELSMGLVAMVSYSIVYRHGAEAFIARSAEAGFDGFIFPDLPLEEAAATRDLAAEAGMSCSLLIAPTTPDARAEQIARASSGFVYVMARTGITGERSELPAELPQRLERLRNVTDLPLAVGFGVSAAEQVRAVTQVADAAIVGSALVRRIGELAEQPTQKIADGVRAFTAELALGLVDA